jgi:nucleoside-diphosphate-sugar epimerase
MHTHLAESIRKDCLEVIGQSAAGLDKLKNQKVYITGGTGFVGTWLAEMVACLNDDYGFNTGLVLAARDLEAFQEKAPHLASRVDVQLLGLDVRNLKTIPDDVSYVIHAAATPDNRQHMSDPLSVMDTIAKGTGAVLDCASNLPGLKKMLNISSGQIYGRQPGDIKKISEHTVGSLNCNSITAVYPEAKRYAETLCCAFWSLYKIPVVTARPFAFVGPYQSLEKPWAVNNFIRDAQMNNTIRIVGNGLPVRSYMYPSDMAYWLLRILTDGNPGVAYNVGSPEGISLKELAEKIKFYSDAKSEIIIKDMNADTSVFVPDDALCRKSLDLNLKVDIDAVIKKSISWFKSTMD